MERLAKMRLRNDCRKHQTPKTSPAVAAGISDRILEMFDAYWQENHQIEGPKRYNSKPQAPQDLPAASAKDPMVSESRKEDRARFQTNALPLYFTLHIL
ncbi:MAG: hypothetical protein R3F11_28355 [Verrucomicrobiales bacterium]